MEFTQCVEILNARQQCGHVDCVRCPVAPIPRSGMSLSEGPAPSVAATSDELLSSMNSLELVNLFTSLQCERVQVYLGYNNALQQLVDNDLVDEYPSLCAEITSIFSVLSKQVVSIKEQLARRGHTEISNLINRVQQEEKEKLSVVAATHLDTLRTHLQQKSLSQAKQREVQAQGHAESPSSDLCQEKSEEGTCATAATAGTGGAETATGSVTVEQKTVDGSTTTTTTTTSAGTSTTTPVPGRVLELYVEVEYKKKRVAELEANISDLLEEIQAGKCDLL